MRQHRSYQTHRVTLPLPRPQPTTTPGHYTTCCKSQSYALWRWAKSCPKHVELILEINKLLLLHLVGFLYIILPKLIIFNSFKCFGIPYIIHIQFSVIIYTILFNTFAARYLNTQGLNNSYLKSPASTLVDLTFQSRALRSFSLNQLRNLSL